jgi:hypothetical protein
MDVTGDLQFDIEHTVFKRRMGQSGKIIHALEEKETSTWRIAFSLVIWEKQIAKFVLERTRR